jgi:cellulose synthase/poly-beta-1,6-N-acetylglucosamine synthase-like glycosyltransferase
MMRSLLVSLVGVFIAINVASVLVLAIYATHQGFLLALYLRIRLLARLRKEEPKAAEQCPALPRVTVQLPLYNERYVAVRVIKAACALDYPRELLQIQVLDDSTDDTLRIAQRAVRAARAHGVDIEHIRRDNRSGYKAGALANGLRAASGELVAIFDADFIPPRHFLRNLICDRRMFDDPAVGFVQTRWGYLNRDSNILTRAQAVMLDMHFIIDQYTRSHAGLRMNFNGSGGIWRRAAIDTAGGWEADTLTEDLDLSYRAQLRGWRGRYVSDEVCPGELPETLLAFKRQQARWARGSARCTRKLAGRVLRSDMPLAHKISSLLHMSGYFANVFVVLMALVTPLMVLEPAGLSALPSWMKVLSLASLCPILAMIAGQVAQRRKADFLCDLPASIVLGVGVALSNSVAVLAGLFGKSSGEFVRTPKATDEAEAPRSATRPGQRRGSSKHAYFLRPDWTTLAELGLSVYAVGTCVLLAMRGDWLSMVPVLFYACCFVGVVIGQTVPVSWLQTRARQRKVQSRLPSMK